MFALFWYLCAKTLQNGVINHYAAALRALAENLVEVCEGKPVADVVVLVDTLNSLLATLLTDVDGLDPALDVLLRGDLQHLLHLGAVTDMRCAHVAAVGSEGLSGHGGERVVREANHVEGTVDLKDGEVFRQVELVCGIGGVDDEVKLEFVVVGPALLVGDDEVLSTHLERILLLASGVGDDGSFSAEGNRPQDTEVTKTTETDDTNLLAGTST